MVTSLANGEQRGNDQTGEKLPAIARLPSEARTIARPDGVAAGRSSDLQALATFASDFY